MLAIETLNLTKKFMELIAVNSLNLKVEEGEIFGLLGPNGAGKTTAIRMMCGLLTPTYGSVKIYGLDPFKEAGRVKKVIGYMPQRFSLYDALTVRENLEFYGLVYGLSKVERRRRIEELIASVELEGFENHQAGKLSRGMRQRLSLAAALLHRPKLLILDEPTAGIDPPLRKSLWNLFRKLNKEEVTLLITTHYMDEAENCDRLGLMSRGRLVAVESPRGLKKMLYGGDLLELTPKSDVKDLRKALEGLSFTSKLRKLSTSFI